MEYYRILNLVREPFSNSPEPEFFYQSAKHVSCLQKLELAIRLRRGLNVVLGHVGTGKTTLCRHLIAQFAGANRDADAMETHLLMDPAFSTPLEFLTTVAMSFGITGKRKRRAAADPDLTDWQLKENIKDYLFSKGVEEGKIVVLIIDEGQKLPDFCLEILREFLNYETNENKLLQIIIFAQPEFQQILNRLENVADRVNLLYVLQPLNFKETRDMIRFRLAQASEPGHPQALFTRLGLLAIYLATGGYPRKIITLCHQAVLAMIIQNRSKAGWLLVRSCAARLVSAGDKTWPSRSLRWVSVLVAASAALLIFLLVRPMPTNSIKAPVVPREEAAQQSPTAAQAVRKSPVLREESQKGLTAQTETAQKIRTAQKANRESPSAQEAARNEKPQLLGKLALKDGRTIWWMLTDFYGEYNQDIFRSVARANPHIKNLNRVQAGELIHLPALPVEKSPLATNKYWVQIAASKNLEETYEFYRTYKLGVPSLRFLPHWNPRQGMVFTIVLRDGFPDETTARKSITRLPDALASEAGVLKNLEQDTVFYTR
ncbi:MAG: AAA family ATPase [Deltaproteobacteria bacterium]|nr:AAA family ATPase [Deltaproteobacteria bacterium]